MKIKTKTSKRIFSLFLAILCTFGVFYVSYIDSFSEDVAVKCSIHWYGSNSSSASIAYSADGTSYSDLYNFSGSSQLNNQSVTFSLPGYYRFYASAYYSGDRYRLQYVKVNNSSTFSYSHDFPVYEVTVDSGFTVLMYCYRYASSSEVSNYDQYIYIHFISSATPTPVPTATPAPATPTPTPDPGGSIPTPSGDYGSFFQRMASDAQSAFNALYLSWTNANNRFYSSIFFIGLPLLITVFGIVAGIILGDDD